MAMDFTRGATTPMNASAPQPNIIMVRPTMADLPEYELPAPYSLRWYKPGDEHAWVRIHELADLYNVADVARFEREFGLDEAVLGGRQAYLCDAAGTPIGAASAWWNDDFEGGRWGRVHWVAIVPEHQGRGLAKPLLSAVMQRLVELGHERAYLTTNPPRLAAISLYLHFGFVPTPFNDEERRNWRKVATELGRDLPGIER